MKRQSVATIILVVTMFLTTAPLVQPAIAQGGCQDGYEPNDNQLRQIEPGQIQATICPANDVDYYELRVSAGDSVYLKLANLPADYDMSLYSANKEDWVGSSDNGGTTSEEIKWIADRSDVLYIAVYGYNGATSTIPYALTVGRLSNLDLDSKTAGASAQLREDLRDFRPLMTDADFNNLIELLQYATNTAQCAAAVKGWRSVGVVTASAGAAKACGGMLNEIVKVMGKYIKPDPVGEETAGIDIGAYCVYKYGSGAYSVMSNRWDAYSWSCYKANRYVGGLDMGEACRVQHPNAPNAKLSDRWDAYSWFCSSAGSGW